MAWAFNLSMSCPHKAPRASGHSKNASAMLGRFCEDRTSTVLFAFGVDRRSIYRQFQEFLHLLGRV
jgi:hypothetical protein